jgi:hypothetical protein
VLTTHREHDFQDAFKNSRSAGNGAYMRKGTTLRVMVTRWPKVSFWPDDSTSSQMIDDDEHGVLDRMRITRGNRSTRIIPATVSLCPPQIPYDLTWNRTRSPAVGSRQLPSLAVARRFSPVGTDVCLYIRVT